jgi:hypothetical protein
MGKQSATQNKIVGKFCDNTRFRQRNIKPGISCIAKTFWIEYNEEI